MELPYQITYDITVMSPELEDEIALDWDRITYTNHYINHAFEIIHSRFPNCTYEHIPGLEEVFEHMAEELAHTPLEEWEERKFINNN